MNHIMNRVRRRLGKESILGDERGLSTVEYVIILVLIAAAAVALWVKFGEAVRERIEGATNTVQENVNID